MALRDLREWLAVLDKENELKRIKAEVHWNKEIGAVTRTVFDRKGPALLFENITDYQTKPCRRLCVGGLATTDRLCLAMGLPRSTRVQELITHTRRMLKERVKPFETKDGPVKSHILKGKDVNLHDFPAPFLHHWDGGRYFFTCAGVITKDPETNVHNVGVYRGMLAGDKKISLGLVATQGWGQHYEKWKTRGEPMPIAIAYGNDPSMFFIGASPIPTSDCEYDVMGAMRGAPVELVHAETVDLMVPATAEIVVEGNVLIDPETYEMEGPFGEYTGYYGGEAARRPVLEATCVTYRDDPIFQTSLEGYGPGHVNETRVILQVAGSALAWNVLESSGIPGIRDVYLLPASTSANLAIQIRKIHYGHAKHAAFAVWGSNMPIWHSKNIIVVEEDIDIHDFEALEWAIAYRVDPQKDIFIAPGMHGCPLDPSMPHEYRDWIKYGAGVWNRMLVDATVSWDLEPREEYGGKRFPPVSFDIDPEYKEIVSRRWKEYGFD